MSEITKAVIPVAGWGTRLLPLTKAIEKAMLPVGNRPLVDYAVQDCIAAGIEDIIFVVGEQSDQIQRYYGRNKPLEEYLEGVGKHALLPLVQPPEQINFHYVVQPANGRYGTAIPVALAAKQHSLSETGAVVLMGDDFIYQPEGGSETKRLLRAAGEDASLLGVEVNPAEVSRYGVLQIEDGKFKGIVEKPHPDEAPTNLINVSKYVMNAGLLEHVCEYAGRDDVVGEWQITEPITQWVQGGGVVQVVPASGEYLDGGTLEGLHHANTVVRSCD